MKRSDRLFTPLMTAREAGQLLGLSHRTLARYRATGRGPVYYKFSGRIVRYRRSDVIAWAERRRRERRDGALARRLGLAILVGQAHKEPAGAPREARRSHRAEPSATCGGGGGSDRDGRGARRRASG